MGMLGVMSLMLVCRLVRVGATVAASADVLDAMTLVVAVLAALSGRRLLVLLAAVCLWIGGACSTTGCRCYWCGRGGVLTRGARCRRFLRMARCCRSRRCSTVLVAQIVPCLWHLSKHLLYSLCCIVRLVFCRTDHIFVKVAVWLASPSSTRSISCFLMFATILLLSALVLLI